MKIHWFDLLVGTIGIAAGCFGIGYAVRTKHQMGDICEKVNKSVDEVSRNVKVDISETVIDEAVEKAVDREVNRAVNRAVSSIVSTMNTEIKNEVKTKISEMYPSIKSMATAKVVEEVSKINVAELKAEVRELAKDKAASKLDDQFDDILNKFNGDLDNISKIYSSIASHFNSNNGSGKDFKISLG